MAEKLFQQLEAEAHASARVLEGPQTPSPSSLNAYAVDWASSQRRTPDSSGWEHQQAASMSAMAATPAISINTGAHPAAEVDDRRLSSGSFGDMPTHLAEQVGVFMRPLLCRLFCSCNDIATSLILSAIAVRILLLLPARLRKCSERVFGLKSRVCKHSCLAMAIWLRRMCGLQY